MQRFAMVIKIKPEKLADYKKLHEAVWPGVLDELRKHHVKNYSIFLKDHLLFGYLEYHGDDYEKDMREVADADITQQWWKLTDPCQEPLETRQPGEWWASMQPVFHME